MAATATLHPARPAHHLDGAALRQARRAARVSLDTAGLYIGRDRTIVAKYERGVIDVPGSILGQLAGLYGVTVADFYRGGTT